jgi:hypothetical protein
VTSFNALTVASQELFLAQLIDGGFDVFERPGSVVHRPAESNVRTASKLPWTRTIDTVILQKPQHHLDQSWQGVQARRR